MMEATFSSTPWGRQGTKLGDVGEVRTAREAMEIAQLDWNVNMKPVSYRSSSGRSVKIPNRMAAVSDRGEVFGVFSDRYVPLQNVEAFRFFDEVVKSGEAIYHTVGVSNNGGRVWIMAQLPGDLQVKVNGDKMTRYLLLVNSHDGSSAVKVRPTAVREVCTNTMHIALAYDQSDRRTIAPVTLHRTRSEGFGWYARHTAGITRQVGAAREAIGLQEAYFAKLMEQVNRIAETKIDETEREAFLFQLFGPVQSKENITKRVRERMDTVHALFSNGSGNNGQTRWDMFNALTEYIDHHDGKEENRLDRAWFGPGLRIKQNAWDLLTAN